MSNFQLFFQSVWAKDLSAPYGDRLEKNLHEMPNNSIQEFAQRRLTKYSGRATVRCSSDTEANNTDDLRLLNKNIHCKGHSNDDPLHCRRS